MALRESHPLISYILCVIICKLALLTGHPNWAEKMKPERSSVEQSSNATVQNSVKLNKVEFYLEVDQSS